jgi:hypothetical protein
VGTRREGARFVKLDLRPSERGEATVFQDLLSIAVYLAIVAALVV